MRDYLEAMSLKMELLIVATTIHLLIFLNRSLCSHVSDESNVRLVVLNEKSMAHHFSKQSNMLTDQS